MANPDAKTYYFDPKKAGIDDGETPSATVGNLLLTILRGKPIGAVVSQSGIDADISPDKAAAALQNITHTPVFVREEKVISFTQSHR